MVIRFSMENFLSFRERQTLDLMATRTCKERRDENTIAFDGKDSLLRTLALYGANASGKSNVFHAFAFLVNSVLTSFNERMANEEIEVIPFLYDEYSRDNPSSMEIEFCIGQDCYKYSVSLSSRFVEGECLLHRKIFNSIYKPRFIRKRVIGDTGDVEDCINVFPSFQGADDSVVEKTRENALFLSTCAGLAVPESMKILDEFASYRFISASSARMNFTARMMSDERYRKSIVEFVNRADPSVDDIRVEPYEVDTGDTRPNGTVVKRLRYRIIIQHKKESGEPINLPLYGLGSLGTHKAFELAGPIFNALANGGLLFIDELDSRLHPIFTREIIKLFNNAQTNVNRAQLIFNTHDTNLLNCKVYTPSRDRKEQLLRRDQIYFVERTGEYVSRLYSLVDFRDDSGEAVRNDASFEKDYLSGKYGAIPYIGGELSFLQSEVNDEQGVPKS